jgi:hypothetical protein
MHKRSFLFALPRRKIQQYVNKMISSWKTISLRVLYARLNAITSVLYDCFDINAAENGEGNFLEKTFLKISQKYFVEVFSKFSKTFKVKLRKSLSRW